MPAAWYSEPPAAADAVTTVELLARRWTIPIVERLAAGPLHFLELQRRLPGVAHKVLTQHLRLLESNAVVARDAAVAGRRVFYSLTPRGRALLAIIVAMEEWRQSTMG